MIVTPLTRAIGAEVGGVDLSSDLDDAALISNIRQAFLDHHVLVFRDQTLDREQHKRFGRLFGDLHVHPSQRGSEVESDREAGPCLVWRATE